jgi:hypothetical protein
MLLRYALLPFRSSPLILTVTFTIGLMLAMRAGIAGIPLALILISWFFKYCFVLLDAIIAGEEEPPVLSIEMVNPVSEQRPLAQALLIAGGVALVVFVEAQVGHIAALLVSLLLLLVLPASIAVMGVTNNPLRAAYPPSLIALMRAMGRDYVALLAATVFYGALLYVIATQSGILLVLFAGIQLCFLSVFALIGGAVFEHRMELGIATRSRRERAADRDQRDHESERRRMLDDAYAQLRLRRSLDAWQAIEKWLAPHRGGDTERTEYLAVFEVVSQWDDPVIADKLGNEYIAVLLSRKDNGAALEIAERRFARNPQFQPKPSTQAARLAELAALAGKRSLRRQLDAVR